MATDEVIEGYYALNGGEFENAGTASGEIKAALTKLGVDPELTRKAAISAFEAEMNVIIHAVAGSLSYVIKDDKVIITITDMGPGIKDVDRAMQSGYSTAPDWAREIGWGAGLGLPNILDNCDKLDIDTTVGEGTTLEICINLKPGQDDPANKGGGESDGR